MANVTSYDDVCNIDFEAEHYPNSDLKETCLQYKSLYQRGYHLYEELCNGDLFEDDKDIVEDIIGKIDKNLQILKSDYSLDRDDRQTEFCGNDLKLWRSLFNNLKKGLEEELAKLQGGEVDDRRNAKQTEAIHAQISALKAMKEQIEEQINALSQAL